MKYAAIYSLPEGVKLIAPDSLELITSYVLQEQGDWFEDEIKFLRKLLQQGDQVIDIGANYGVYSLSAARSVGPEGRVWSFEPASRTLMFLQESAALNCFSQLTTLGCALSDKAGIGQLSLHENSELNSLGSVAASGASETVQLRSIDECMHEYDWQKIDFLKIDAEGEEEKILRGGKRFFADLSPLVQYEIKDGSGSNLELVDAFSSIGYDSYRLLPGLGVLVPFKAGDPVDGFLLNLFACKSDTALRLAERSLLLQFTSTELGVAKERVLEQSKLYVWPSSMADFPYVQSLAGQWLQDAADGDREQVEQALALFQLSCDSAVALIDRFAALQHCFIGLSSLCDEAGGKLRHASLARVALDYGMRSTAFAALMQQQAMIVSTQKLVLDEPFLLPMSRMDSIVCQNHLVEFVLTALLEALELYGAYSSFYTGLATQQRLLTLQQLGFASPEILRRLSLIRERAQQSTMRSETL